jgi:sulfite dehydrogenase
MRVHALAAAALLASMTAASVPSRAQSGDVPQAQQSEQAQQAQQALGRRLFTGAAMPACAVCHTLAAAGSEGAIGPVLDELRPDAGRVARALRSGVGQMPSYRDKLSEAEIEALAAYVAKASGGQR